MKYILALDNGIFQQNYEVSWSQIEIAIKKSKTIDNKISQDDYTSLVSIQVIRRNVRGKTSTPVLIIARNRNLGSVRIIVNRQKTTRPPILESKKPSCQLILLNLRSHIQRGSESSPFNRSGTFASNRASPNGKRWYVDSMVQPPKTHRPTPIRLTNLLTY
jgi:hypothetical protein